MPGEMKLLCWADVGGVIDGQCKAHPVGGGDDRNAANSPLLRPRGHAIAANFEIGTTTHDTSLTIQTKL